MAAMLHNVRFANGYFTFEEVHVQQDIDIEMLNMSLYYCNIDIHSYYYTHKDNIRKEIIMHIYLTV